MAYAKRSKYLNTYFIFSIWNLRVRNFHLDYIDSITFYLSQKHVSYFEDVCRLSILPSLNLIESAPPMDTPFGHPYYLRVGEIFESARFSLHNVLHCF